MYHATSLRLLATLALILAPAVAPPTGSARAKVYTAELAVHAAKDVVADTPSDDDGFGGLGVPQPVNGRLPCGDAVGSKAITDNTLEVLQACNYVSSVCCSQYGEDCSGVHAQTAVLPSTCHTESCYSAWQVFQDSCSHYINTGFGKVAFGQLQQGFSICSEQRRNPVCHDGAASNFDARHGASVANSAPSSINTGCMYTCAALSAHYDLVPATTRCYIDDAVSPDALSSWPPPLTAWGGTWLPRESQTWSMGPLLAEGVVAVVIQGSASKPGEGTDLARRVDVVGSESNTLILVLRHVSFSHLLAVPQTSACLYNDCYYGGAVYAYHAAVVVEHVAFRNNTARDGGGAMYLRQGTSLTISDSIFEGNSASPEQHASGGAVALGYQTTVQLIRCRFVGNSAERGGAIYVGTAMPFRSLTITDCSGSGNTMPGAAAGSQCGAVYWFGAGKDCNDQNLGANGAGRSRNEEESSGGVAAKKAQVASRWDEISLTSTHHSVEKPPGCLLSLPPHTRAGSCVEDLSLRQSALSGSDAAGDVTSVSIPPAASAATATANGGGGDDDDKQQPGGGCNLACDAGYFLRGSETPMCRTTAQGAEQPLYLARWAGACAKPS